MEPNNTMLMSDTKEGTKEVMTVDQCARYLGVSRWMVYRLKKRREIPFMPYGRTCRFYKGPIDAWIKQRSVTART